jgi:hypothetical protein
VLFAPKNRKIAAAAAAAKGDDYNPIEIAFVPYLAVWPKTIHNHIVHSHHHLSREQHNWKRNQDPKNCHLIYSA